WGLFHGMFMVLERIGLMKPFTESKWLAVRHFYALLIIMISWVFFRATTLSYSLSFLRAMAGFAQATGLEYHASLYLNLEIVLAIIVGIVASTPVLSTLLIIFNKQAFKYPKKAAIIDAIFFSLSGLSFAVIFIMAVIKLAAGTYNPFIYLQF
ncbi:MAG: MBOAT family protein, partial [Cyanobacteriota bacterium]